MEKLEIYLDLEIMSQKAAADSHILTKYPVGSLRELLLLCLPLILSLSSTSFMEFCDRVFLSHYSLEALEGSVSAGYLATLFQQSIIRIVSMAQVFAGLYHGSNRKEQIGPSVWQMLWLCVFSMILTLPIGQLVSSSYFEGTTIKAEATTYFQTMMGFNFLFPLAVALSSYFIGQGRTRIIFLTTLVVHGIHIGLDYVLIFGFGNLIPSMGIFGSALATGIAQALLCAILLFFFLRKKERKIYKTDLYQFNWESCWKQLRVGLPRSIARVVTLTAWVCVARIMTLKGGDYLMVLSIGGPLILLFNFINDGMCQGMITVASNILGSRQYEKIWKLVRSGLILLLVTTSLLSIPYLIFPDFTLSFFHSTPSSTETLQMLKQTFVWLWLFFFAYGFHSISLSLITAARDIKFYTIAISFTWLTSFIPVHFAMNTFNWSPDKLWLIMAFDSFLFGALFFLRVSKEKWKFSDQESSFTNAST